MQSWKSQSSSPCQSSCRQKFLCLTIQNESIKIFLPGQEFCQDGKFMVGSLYDHLNQDGEGNLFRRKDYFSSPNWSSSNLPTPLLLLLLLLHYPWLNNCHRTFYRRHVDRYRCTYPCAQMVSSVLVKSLVHTSTFSEIAAFYRGLVEDPKKIKGFESTSSFHLVSLKKAAEEEEEEGCSSSNQAGCGSRSRILPQNQSYPVVFAMCQSGIDAPFLCWNLLLDSIWKAG